MSDFVEVSIAAVNQIRKADLSEDAHVVGTYSVLVAKGLSEETIAAAALDTFHLECPVSTLENFKFWVFAPGSGKVFEEACDQESYVNDHHARDLQRISDQVPQVYSVCIDAIGNGIQPKPVGRASVVAENKQKASEKAIELLWLEEKMSEEGYKPRVTVAVAR